MLPDLGGVHPSDKVFHIPKKKKTAMVAAFYHFKAVAHASILLNESVFAKPTV